jgi:hypothetical protein
VRKTALRLSIYSKGSPTKILFGTDLGVFQRGWWKNILVKIEAGNDAVFDYGE